LVAARGAAVQAARVRPPIPRPAHPHLSTGGRHARSRQGARRRAVRSLCRAVRPSRYSR